MAIYFPVTTTTTRRSFLNQLIDVIQNDISSSISRRSYQVFVTGGIGPGVTSSLFQTVYDQDFTLQVANPVFDVTVGLSSPAINPGGIADVAKSSAPDSTGKYLYPSSSLMMREKTDIYGQFAQTLLGDRSKLFQLPNNASSILASTDTNAIGDAANVDAALFIAFKRLFARDQLKKETFAMRFYPTGSQTRTSGDIYGPAGPGFDSYGIPNIGPYAAAPTSSPAIYTDVGAGDSRRFFSPGGQFGYLVNAAATNNAVGLIYYDAGVVIYDITRITSGSQFMSGTISAMSPTGKIVLGSKGTETAYKAKLVPDFLVSGSIDNIVDYFCSTRFGNSTSLTSMTFQNVTNINSELIFCRVGPDDANYSSNPTFVNSSDGTLAINDTRIADPDLQDTFSYVTSIGLYDNNYSLVAVAKLSRPVEKNPSRDLTFRVRLDF
jgi:hypothetical protein